MAKRQRRAPDPGDFQDPLKNYDASVAEDEFEEALADNTVTDLQITPFKTVAPATPLGDVVALMAELDIGCVLITCPDGKLTGLFTQRDLLMSIVDDFDRLKDKPIGEVMTADPVCVHETDNPATAINLMSVGGFRHVPVLDVDGRAVGLLGPRRMTAFLQRYFPTK